MNGRNHELPKRSDINWKPVIFISEVLVKAKYYLQLFEALFLICV